MLSKFSEMGFSESLTHRLAALKFESATPIQEAAIPLALKGRDILGSAQTGTGKTIAFGIPLVEHLLNNSGSNALIMTPTRELATQVMVQLQALMGKRAKNETALLIGGEPYPKQMQQLKRKPRLVIGTPGRINDHLARRTLNLSRTDFLVLDETDRMLDMGFTEQIEAVLGNMPAMRQTLLFSATLPKNTSRIAEKYLNNPERIAVGGNNEVAKNIEHTVQKLADGDKHAALIDELKTRNGSVIIFVKTKFGTERMAKKLEASGEKATAIHGDLKQNKRDRVIRDFRAKKYRILVATDVAARGLDIPHIEHVINFDLPQAAEDYIHRIGRTARAGAKGEAVAFVTPSDRAKWNAIARILDPNAEIDTTPAKGKKPHRGKSGKPSGGKSFGKRKFGAPKGDGAFARDGRDGGHRGQPSGQKRADHKRASRPKRRTAA